MATLGFSMQLPQGTYWSHGLWLPIYQKLLWVLEICKKHLVACIKLFKIKLSCEKSVLPPYALNGIICQSHSWEFYIGHTRNSQVCT